MQPLTGFGPATKIEFGSTRISPEFAIDGRGNWMTAWTQQVEDEKQQAWARRYDTSTGWSQATLLSDSSIHMSALAMDPEGRALVLLTLWQEPTATTISFQTTLSARAYSNGAWGPAKTLGSAYGPADTRLAMNKLGNAVASWTEQVSDADKRSWTLRLARFSPSSGWGSKYAVASASASTGDSQEAFDSAGNPPARTSLAIGDADDVIVGWSRVLDSSIWGSILSGRGVQTASPRFQAPEPMTSMARYPSPRVAIDGSDRALLVWSTKDGSGSYVRSRRFEVGTGWDNAVSSIEMSNSGDALDPQIAMDSKGHALAIWPQIEGEQNVLWFNRFDVEHGWSKAERVEPMNTTSDATAPAIAFDGAGNALAAWIEGKTIRASRYLAGSGWTAAQTLSTQDIESYGPRISTSASGTALITWAEVLGPNDRNYWFSVYRAP